MKANKKHYQILIIGGGTAGIAAATQLKKKKGTLDIALIEPLETHTYHTAWSLVAAGAFDFSKTKKEEGKHIPKGVEWIRDKAIELLPDKNTIDTEKNGKLTYDFLIVATGVSYDLSLVEGLEEALQKETVCSTYINPEHTWQCLQKFKGGNAVFTLAAGANNCPLAAQKITYLAADYFKKQNIPHHANLMLATPANTLINVKEVAATLAQIMQRYHIVFKPQHTPVKIDAEEQLVYFKRADGFLFENPIPGSSIENGMVVMPFELLHIVPPQAPPQLVWESSLASKNGYVEVDINSLQHPKFTNVFALGDIADLPTAKTSAAAKRQAIVVADNIFKLLNKQAADNKSYDGYSSCTLATAYGKMIVATFDYNDEFVSNTTYKYLGIDKTYEESRRLWLIEKYVSPYF